MGQRSDEERAIVEASRAKVGSKADDLALRLLEARSFIHPTLSLEYGPIDEHSEPQLAFHHFQAEVVEKEEALRVATVEVGTWQALLVIKRQGSTLSPNMKRELVRLRHSYGRLREIARDLGFDVVGLLRTHSSDDPILHTGFGVLYRPMADHLGHV